MQQNMRETMEDPKERILSQLRQIEEQAHELAKLLPPGLPLHRARQIKSMAAHLALQTELEKAGGRLQEAANDAARGENRSPA